MSGSKKISELDPLTTSGVDDIIVIVDNSATETKKQTKGNFLAEVQASVNDHIADTSNPHSVTKTHVGLGNADNTSDADKPVSIAQQGALDLKVAIADIVNDIISDDTDKPLSAAQGKALKTLIDDAGTWVMDYTPPEAVNGVNTNYTIPVSATQVVVYADGVRVKGLGIAYTFNGTTGITFTSGLQPFSSLSVDYLPV